MRKHEVLAKFYLIGRLNNVQIAVTDGHVYVVRWFNIKIQALHIKIQRHNSPEVTRIPYEDIRDIIQHSARVVRPSQQHTLSPES